MEAEAETAWRKETVPRVFEIVSSRLSHRDVCSLLLVGPWCLRALLSVPSLWQGLDLHGMAKAGDKLIAALSLPRYRHVEHINLEFAQDIEDRHFSQIREKMEPKDGVQSLNLNACQKISDKGIEAVTCAFPNLRTLSVYWNAVRCRHLLLGKELQIYNGT